MKVTAENAPERQVILTIEVEPERVEKSMDRAYRKLAGRVNIPGFRRGKAPRPMVERFIGRSALLEEALEHLVPEVYDEALKEQAIEAAAQPQFEIAQLDPVTVKATVPLAPEIQLGDFRSVRLTQEPIEVTEEDIEKVIEQLQERQSIWEPTERAVELGDRVSIELSGTRNGATIAENRTFEYDARAESTAPVPGFAEKLVGMTAGEEREIAIDFPEDDERTELAGHKYVFQVKAQEVKAKRLPEVDDEFVKGLGGEGIETVEQLRDRIRNNLRVERENEAQRRYVEQVTDTVVEASQAEFPPILVEREIDSMVQQQAELLASQKINLQQYLRYLGKTEEDHRNDLRDAARKRVKTKLVLDEIARAEALAVTPEEIEAEIAHLATHVTPERATNLQNEANREAVQRLILRQRAEDRMVSIASGKLDEGADEATTAEEPTAEAAPASAESSK